MTYKGDANARLEITVVDVSSGKSEQWECGVGENGPAISTIAPDIFDDLEIV